MLIPLEEIRAARTRLAGYLPPTPLLRSDAVSDRLGHEIHLKLELLQPTHAFKVRGALNALLVLAERKPDEAHHGVITASAGNHGLGLCYAGRLVDAPVTVVVPVTAADDRRRAIRRLGGRLVVHGEDWNEAHAHALEIAAREGLTYIPAFDDEAIMAGQGTIALEVLEQLPEVGAIICSVGGGGLISGIASAVRQLRPEVAVFGVETRGADCMAQSLKAGRIVELPHFSSIATSLGTRRTGERQFAIVREAVEAVTVVDDAAAVRELLALLDDEKLMVEPAASCTLAALSEGQLELPAGPLVCILCGANVTLSQVLDWRARLLATPSAAESKAATR